VLLTPNEKAKLDERSIRNASLWLDLRIAVMTASMFVRGDRRTPHVEQTVWNNLLRSHPIIVLARLDRAINEPQPRRVGAWRSQEVAGADEVYR
jgi:mitochondrial fission protein ELM1